jgi:hypothetical protein
LVEALDLSRKEKTMGYVIAFVNGKEIEVSDADVLECMEFFQCSYDDALWHVAYTELVLRDRALKAAGGY